MQTFLPYADFAASAAALDNRRLGKQRVETLQIMGALLVPGSGWQNHPAVHMWRGHESALLEYQQAVCLEWTQERGYKDTCYGKTEAAWLRAGGPGIDDRGDSVFPPWLGDEAFHESHRSNLLRKAPEIYGAVFWPDTTRQGLEYVWPQP